MLRCIVLIFVSIAAATLLCAQEMKVDHCSCTKAGVPQDSTFTFRGRMMGYNGNPTYRIWPVASDRLLGVRDVCLEGLDLGKWTPYMDNELWADFTVSAVTPQRPGVMQFVCIRSIRAPFLRQKERPSQKRPGLH